MPDTPALLTALSPDAQITRPGARPMYIVGLVADTHIPDRVNALHPRLIPFLRDAGVSHILHAGDISARRVLEDLATVAPVTAVRGNRDFLAGPLQMKATLELGGAKIAVIHGHGGLGLYLWDKIFYLRDGYIFDRYLPLLAREVRGADVLVYGHTHFSEVCQRDGKLLVNPGSASFGPKRGMKPSFGLLRIFPGGRVEAEVVTLEGWKIENRTWVKA